MTGDASPLPDAHRAARWTPSRGAAWLLARPAALVALALILTFAGVALLRLIRWGWDAPSVDDGRYIFVGLSVLDGLGPFTESGRFFLARSPIFGLLLALPGRLPVIGAIDGAHLMAVGLWALGCLAALRFAWLLGGLAAAAGTTVALLATPLVWQLLPALRVDFAQAAGLVVTLLILARPSPARWTAAGAALGLTLLVKETIAPALVLPAAWLGALPLSRWLRLTAAFVLTTALVAGWWWLVVWEKTGMIFPLNSLAVNEARDVSRNVRPGLLGAVLLMGAALAWAVVALGGRHDPRVRALLLAGLATLPAAAYSFLRGFNERQFASLALLSCIAFGVAVGPLVERLVRDWRKLGEVRVDRSSLLRLGPALLVLLLAAGIVAAGQAGVPRPADSRAQTDAAAWLRQRVQPGEGVVATFNVRSYLAVELFGQEAVRQLPLIRFPEGADPGDYVWLGLRDRALLGLGEEEWRASLGAGDVRYLVVVYPSPTSPDELVTLLSSTGSPAGIELAQRFRGTGRRAVVFRVDPSAILAGHPPPLHLRAAAALALLEGSADPAAQAARLAAEGAVVVGVASERAPLVAALPDGYCLTPLGAPYREGLATSVIPVAEGGCV